MAKAEQAHSWDDIHYPTRCLDCGMSYNRFAWSGTECKIPAKSAEKITVDRILRAEDNLLMVNAPARRTQGMNWIRPVKRLAIYMRDGLACAWCGENVENVTLTLDHLTPYSKGGSNDQKNLVTCCHRCNSSRGNRSKKEFATVVARYLGKPATAAKILARIETLRKGALNIAQAQELIDRRGGFKSACKSAA